MVESLAHRGCAQKLVDTGTRNRLVHVNRSGRGRLLNIVNERVDDVIERGSGRVEQGDLIREVCRLLGFGRTGTNLSRVIGDALAGAAVRTG